MCLAFALVLIIESTRHFGVSQILMAAITGYYLSALTFGFCHMPIRARGLVSALDMQLITSAA